MIYKFEIQKLKEEVERLTEELKLVRKVCFDIFCWIAQALTANEFRKMKGYKGKQTSSSNWQHLK